MVSAGAVDRLSIPFFFEPNLDTPMRKPEWDGDGGGGGGGDFEEAASVFYTYGEHLLRKYKVGGTADRTARRQLCQHESCARCCAATLTGYLLV